MAPSVAEMNISARDSARSGGRPFLVRPSSTLMRAGQIREAAEAAEVVLARPHDEAVDKRLRFTLIETLSIGNRAQELIERDESELARWPDMPLADRAFILARGSFGRTFSGDLVGGEQTGRRALELAQRAGDTAMTTWSLTTLSVDVNAQGRYAEAVELTSQAVQLALDAPYDSGRERGPFFLHGMALCDADRMDGRAGRRRASSKVATESRRSAPESAREGTPLRTRGV